MKPEITNKQEWHMIDGSHGTEYYPANYISMDKAKERYPGDIWEFETVSGFGCRLSMPGYLDCTEWAVCDTEAECKEVLVDLYCSCDSEEDLCEVCKELS